MWHGNRRDFLRTSAAGLAATELAFGDAPVLGQVPEPGDRPPGAEGVRVLNPCDRVPVSLIIDDSTCLVNLAYFAMPQFARTWPERESYQKPWRTWPREIPDAFVQAAWALSHTGSRRGRTWPDLGELRSPLHSAGRVLWRILTSPSAGQHGRQTYRPPCSRRP